MRKVHFKKDEMTYNVDLLEYTNRTTPQNTRVLKQKQAVEHSRTALLDVHRKLLC